MNINPIQEQPDFETSPSEIVERAITRIRNSQYKFTETGKIREQIKSLENEDKMKALSLLRIESLQAKNLDILKYLKEITN